MLHFIIYYCKQCTDTKFWWFWVDATQIFHPNDLQPVKQKITMMAAMIAHKHTLQVFELRK